MEVTFLNYKPDNWVIIEIKGDDPHYRVLGGWSGGYLDGDSWRMNSGIVRDEFDGKHFRFYGVSGSTYECYADNQQLSSITQGVLNSLKEQLGDKVELVSKQPWTNKDWTWGCIV